MVNDKIIMGLELCRHSLDDEIQFYRERGHEFHTRHMPVNGFLHMLTGLVAGHAYLYDRNICHLDIKPANMLNDVDGNWKLADFGLSLNIARNETIASVRGTSGYCHPLMFEHMHWEEIHGKVPETPMACPRNIDIWSIGATSPAQCRRLS